MENGRELTSKCLQPISLSELAELDVVRLAFRHAYLATFDYMLDEQLLRHGGGMQRTGFLDEHVLFAGTAPHVQLECLGSAWKLLCSPKPGSENSAVSKSKLTELVGRPVEAGDGKIEADEAVLAETYLLAVFDFLAASVPSPGGSDLKEAMSGLSSPVTVEPYWVGVMLRTLSLMMSQEQEHTRRIREWSLIVSRQKLRQQDCEPVSEQCAESELVWQQLSRYRVDADSILALQDLLTDRECKLLNEFLAAHPHLLLQPSE